MKGELAFRVPAFLSFLAMLAIRLYYQARILRDKNQIDIREGSLSLIAGSIAALTSIVFGAEFIFARGTFAFAYVVRYPVWLRWFGAVVLAIGIALLWWAHHHLGKSFHSLVVSKESQTLVRTGPYRWVRHPIYTAYLASYLGCGLLASNWVLTIIPVAMYAVLVAMRMGMEEETMVERFGREYAEYMEDTGRLLPRMERRG